MTAESPHRSVVARDEPVFTERGSSLEDTSSRAGPARGPCPTEDRPHSSRAAAGRASDSFERLKRRPRRALQPHVPSEENRSKDRLPQVVSGSGRPEFTHSGPGAFPAPTPGVGRESGAAASEAMRAEVRPGNSARLRPQRQTAAHTGCVPVEASHLRLPSPEGAFLPGLPGRTCGAQWRRPRVGGGFSADPGPDAGPVSSGPHILRQVGQRRFVTALTRLFNSSLAADTDMPHP